MRGLIKLTLGLAIVGQVGCSHSEKGTAVADKMLSVPLPPPPKLSSAKFTPPVVVKDEEVATDEAEYTPTKESLAEDSTPPTLAPLATTPPRVSSATSRLLVYHAEVRLKAKAMPHAMAHLDSLVRRSSGYLSAVAETRADGEWRQETTIRVPPTRFQTLLSGLAGLGTIEEKKLSTDDVTAEHADVAARLQTKRAVEQQYTTLLGKAQKIKDILDIEEKLGEVREEIEATESRLKALNDEVAYSTITLTLYQPLPQSVLDAPVVSLGSRTVEAFYDGWQLLTSLFIGTINLWPLLLLAAGSGWLWQRRRARRAVAAFQNLPVANA